MSKIISVHSFRGGTGKSNCTANMASLLAADGLRVGVVDTDIQSPGIHILFGLDPSGMRHSLNDFLWGRCDISAAAHDVTEYLGTDIGGRLLLIPSSIEAKDIARVLQYGYDVSLLQEGFNALLRELRLDVLLVDTHPGLNEETLLSIAISDVLLVILRPDQQDYQGTAVTIDVARQLDVPRMYLAVNKVPARLSVEAVRKKVGETYKCPVAGVIPHSEDMLTFASEGIFVRRYPDNEVSGAYRSIVRTLMGDDNP